MKRHPYPAHLATVAGVHLIEIPTADGTAEAYVARPPSGSGPGVLFFMDAIGLRPQIAAMCDRIASWGYVVLAPNVFYRVGDVDGVGPHVDLRQPGAREDSSPRRCRGCAA